MTDEIKSIKKCGYWGVVAYGVKSPKTDISANLNELNMQHWKRIEDGIEKINMWTENGDYYEMDCVKYMDIKYKLDAIRGFGIGKNQEELETVLKRIMCAGGVIVTDDYLARELRPIDRSSFENTIEKYAAFIKGK